jgi:prepilin-type N-terminal cleavage/methylation domain-containing protein
MRNFKKYNFVPAEKTDYEKMCPRKKERGFSLIELVVSMALTLIILGVAVITFSSALNSRSRESSKTDAITSTQAALNIISREIGNSGYGLITNGIVTGDSTSKRLHFRTNTGNGDGSTSSPGEDVTFYFDDASDSVIRYDAYNGGSTSGVINRISDVDFVYYNYDTVTGTSTPGSAAANTGRVKITLTVTLVNVTGQPTGQKVLVTSDVTLRNSPFMLGQY